MSVSTALHSLIGPLRYACQRDFARLATVKDLRAPISAALAQVSAEGATAALAERLRAELSHVDAPDVEVRKASLRRLLESLREAGVVLPVELSSLLEGAPRPAAVQAPSTAPVNEGFDFDAPARAPPEPEPEPVDAAEVPFPEEAAGEPERGKKPARGKRKAAPDVRNEAKLLSIAPREGPLATPLKNVGWRLNPRLIAALNRRGLRRTGDILFLLPRCYEDRRRMQTIAELVPGERGVTVGEVVAVSDAPLGRRGGPRRVFRAVLSDRSGTISATYFQTGPWLKARFPIGKKLVVSGEVRASHAGREIVHPEVEPADDLGESSVHFNRIVPIYPGFERYEQRMFRQLAFEISTRYAGHLEDPLPPELRGRLGLMDLAEALRRIHFPLPTDDLELFDKHSGPAHKRLAFDELFFLQLGISLKRQGIKIQPGIAFEVPPERRAAAEKLLPFRLTRAQERVVGELSKDMARPEPMHRLLQGDVGSGKTAVAAVAAALALENGYQVALMAPTEILAEQHERTFRRIFSQTPHSVGLVTAAGTPKLKREIRGAIASGHTRLAIGTHALIEGGVEFDRLGLVIIDEQHRFGVIQRHALMSKGRRPDVLVMTATPIPRTLSMTLYGDLDLSILDELPPGRTPVVTRVYNDKRRPALYTALEQELAKGHQGFVVYPLVEESEKVDLADATRGAAELQAAFPNRRVGLLHGRMKSEEKDAVMNRFRERQIELLVCTTVVEVGVDVPNASVMVIEAAERFGLSQLHQLRGRVGRGAAQSFCFLVAGYARSKEATDRLRVMERSSDGFAIAEKDLELRGPGEFLGTRQSGMPELAVANLTRDGLLLNKAREEAEAILSRDASLRAPEHRGLVKALEERWEGRLALARVG